MEFDVQIVHSVETIGQEAWDHLAGDRPLDSYRWYRFGEAVLTDDVPIYIILSQGDQPVARATFWLSKREPLPISSRVMRRLTEAILHRWPLLLCRSPLTSAPGLILPPPPLQDVALEIITKVALDQARRYRASFLVFDYLESQETHWTGWPSKFSPAMVPDPGMRLDITWRDFKSYLGHLSKSVRKDYRRHRNRAAALGIKVERCRVTEPLERDVLDQAMTLIRNVDQHHNSPPHPWARAVLEHAHTVDSVWLVAKQEGRLVGCGLFLGDAGTRFLALLGLDYDVRYAYFQLFYEAIRCAIEEEIQVLQGGGGAYETKRRLGFKLEGNNYVVFAASNRALCWITNKLVSRHFGM